MITRDDKARTEMVADVLKTIQDKEIKYVWMQFTDLNGILKSYGVSATEMENFLESGDGFDGSSISGFGRIEESDMVAVPDPVPLPLFHGVRQKVMWRGYCVMYTLQVMNNIEGDPRFILQRTVKKLGDDGFTFKCAPELEFFWLKPSGEGAPTEADFRGYFDADPGDENQLMRREIAQFSEAFGIPIECMHHESRQKSTQSRYQIQ